MSHDSDSSHDCCPTPVANLRLPSQSSGVGYQVPSEKKLYDAITKRYGKPDDSPDSMKDTGFRRGIPGLDNQ